MEYLVQQATNAIQLGSIYALIALGYSLVYSVLTMINFAHGDVFMLGAFACLVLVMWIQLPFVAVLLAVMIVTGLVGMLIERLAYRPLRHAPKVSAIITALGCGLVIANAVNSISPYAQPMPRLFDNTTYSWFGAVRVSSLQLLITGISVGLMVALDFVVRRTAFGMAMRAIAVDRATVPLLGVPVNRVIAITFFIGAALGGAAGVLYGLAYPVIAAPMGVLVGWKAFIAAVIGGIGNVRGAMLGGYIIGGLEVMTVAFLPSTYRDLIAYSLLLVILIFKPHGLLGRPVNQKV